MLKTQDLPRRGAVARPVLPLPLWEFVGMIAAMMALNALAIDTMLPALHNIATTYSLQHENDQQLVIFAYVLGFGAPQLVFGPISDRFGRKGVALFCIAAYSIAGFACMLSWTFDLLLFTRFLQGIAASRISIITTYNGQKDLIHDVVAQCAPPLSRTRPLPLPLLPRVRWPSPLAAGRQRRLPPRKALALYGPDT